MADQSITTGHRKAHQMCTLASMVIHGDYLAIDVGNKFDLVWASHVLEHQRNVGLFIR